VNPWFFIKGKSSPLYKGHKIQVSEILSYGDCHGFTQIWRWVILPRYENYHHMEVSQNLGTPICHLDGFSMNSKPSSYEGVPPCFSTPHIIIILGFGWWFQTWLLFSISYMGCHPSHWLIFFKIVKTTNQGSYLYLSFFLYTQKINKHPKVKTKGSRTSGSQLELSCKSM
jgi:hypothetical protein